MLVDEVGQVCVCDPAQDLAEQDVSEVGAGAECPWGCRRVFAQDRVQKGLVAAERAPVLAVRDEPGRMGGQVTDGHPAAEGRSQVGQPRGDGPVRADEARSVRAQGDRKRAHDLCEGRGIEEGALVDTPPWAAVAACVAGPGPDDTAVTHTAGDGDCGRCPFHGQGVHEVLETEVLETPAGLRFT